MKVSEMKDAVFDGKEHGLRAAEEAFHLAQAQAASKKREEHRPITYEVIRHSLWHVNEEHGATIQRLSGSPVAMYALDLNPFDPHRGRRVRVFRPYMQYMSGVTDTQVKWVLEYRSDNPGIRDGDMFLANDPGWARRTSRT